MSQRPVKAGTKSPTPAGKSPPPKAPLSRGRRWYRRIKWGVRIAALGVLIGVYFVGCDNRFYLPSRKLELTPGDLNLAFEDAYFQTSDGVRLHGWFLPARGTARGTVLHFHGNAANISNHVLQVEWLPDRGFNLLVFDYRGYGISQGSPTRAGTIRDGHAALDYLLARSDVDRRRIFAFGQSLGGAVAIAVAAERPEIAAVAVESPFCTYRGIAARHLARALLPDVVARSLAAALISHGHEPIELVGRIAPRPLLIVGAADDAICFADFSRELFDAAGEPRELWIADGVGHFGVLEGYPRQMMDRLVQCFERAR